MGETNLGELRCKFCDFFQSNIVQGENFFLLCPNCGGIMSRIDGHYNNNERKQSNKHATKE